jgi:hypothetical protein
MKLIVIWQLRLLAINHADNSIMNAPITPDSLRQQISELVDQYAQIALAPNEFTRSESVVPPSGKVVGARELQLMVEASLDGYRKN